MARHPCNHASRQPASQAAGQPGSQAAGQPGSRAARQPGSRAARHPGGQAARQLGRGGQAALQPGSQAARQPRSQPALRSARLSPRGSLVWHPTGRRLSWLWRRRSTASRTGDGWKRHDRGCIVQGRERAMKLGGGMGGCRRELLADSGGLSHEVGKGKGGEGVEPRARLPTPRGSGGPSSSSAGAPQSRPTNFSAKRAHDPSWLGSRDPSWPGLLGTLGADVGTDAPLQPHVGTVSGRVGCMGALWERSLLVFKTESWGRSGPPGTHLSPPVSPCGWSLAPPAPAREALPSHPRSQRTLPRY